MLRRRSLAVLVALTMAAPAACGGGQGSPGGTSGQTGSGGAGNTGGAGSTGDTGGSGGANTGGLVARITATPDGGDGPITVTLDGCASTAPTGEIVLYSWDFGDGTTATGPSVKHVYSPGDHAATLTITGSIQASASAKKTISVTGPTPRKLVTDPSGHPRLYFDAGHLAELEGRLAKTPILGKPGYKSSYVAGYLLDSTAWQSAHDYAKAGCLAMLGAYFTAADANPVKAGREISDCVSTLAAGGALEGDAAKAKPYADAAIAAMVHMATVWPSGAAKTDGFGRWDCGACLDGGSNLNNGELLYSVATSFDLLYTKMAPSDRDAIRDLLLREARYAYQASLNGVTWWSQDTGNNWQAVVHGGLGIAALALLGEQGLMAGEAEGWIQRSVDRIEKYLDTNYDDDGANYEDSDHFGYGLNFATQFFFALKNVRGEDHFDHRNSLMQKAARYRVYATEATFDGIMPNDGSSPNPTTFPAELLLASVYRDGMAQWAWDRVSGQSRPAANAFPFKVGGDGDQSQLLQTALGYDDTVPIESPEGRLPLGRVYPGFGRALFRSDWEDDHGLSLAVEAGVYGSHGKPNQGHFFLDAYGGPLVTQKDGGASSSSYNVVRVDDQDQVIPGGAITEFSLIAKTASWLDASAIDHVRFNTAGAYKVALDRATRDVLFVHPAGAAGGYAVVLDDLGAAAAHTFSTELHFAKGLAVAAAGPGHHVASGGGASIDVFSGEPMGAAEDTSDGLAVSVKSAAASFTTLLFPTDAAHALPAVKPLTAGAASGFSVGADSVLFNPSQKSFALDPISSDGAVVLTRGAAPALALVAVYGGTAFAVGGAPWVSASAPASWVLEPAPDGARVWVGEDAGAPIDVKVHVPAAGSYVVSVDDKLASFATADAGGLVTITALDRATPRRILIRPADKAPTGCP